MHTWKLRPIQASSEERSVIWMVAQIDLIVQKSSDKALTSIKCLGGEVLTSHHSFNHVIEVTGGQEPDSFNTSQCKICTKSYDCQEYLKKTRVPKRKKEAICLVFYNPENRANSCAQRRTFKSCFCLHSTGLHDDTLPSNQEVTKQLSQGQGREFTAYGENHQRYKVAWH